VGFVAYEDKALIGKVEGRIRSQFQGEGSGHDWYHIDRVRNTALAIASNEEGADLSIVELAALLHDVADWKFNQGDAKAGSRVAMKLLTELGAGENAKTRVCKIIDEVSFKGEGVNTAPTSLEGGIVQDADRLDAIGAIGIARAFAYGGSKGREMYDPDKKPVHHKTFEDYKAGQSTTVNHFYEKLLILKDRMNTKTGKKMAEERDIFMRDYLERFLDEWKGKR
jgi:uncharacterized protein